MTLNLDIIKNILGEEIVEDLEKSEIGSGIFKQDTKTALDPNEIKIALQIVPRAVLSYLVSHLKNLQIGGNLDLDLPFCNGMVHVNKISHDVYTGEIYQDNKKKTEFKYRSLPGIGLIIMSTFELYDMVNLKEVKQEANNDKIDTMQKIIDERIKLKYMVSKIVDERLEERKNIEKIVQEKFLEMVSQEKPKQEIDKKSKLKQFLENREERRQESIFLEKNESISCLDCGTSLYKGESHFKLCLCYGQHYNKKIKIKKSSNGNIKFNFPKSFEIENVEMLLNTIKQNK